MKAIWLENSCCLFEKGEHLSKTVVDFVYPSSGSHRGKAQANITPHGFGIWEVEDHDGRRYSIW